MRFAERLIEFEGGQPLPRGARLTVSPSALEYVAEGRSEAPRVGRMLWWSVIDEPDIQDIAVLAKASALAKSVALIRTRHGTGTCVCVGASQVVTNNHVLSGSLDRAATPADVEGATVIFNYELDPAGRMLRSKQYRCSSRLGFKASLELDYALIGVADRPGERWGSISLPRRRPDLKRGDDVFIVQHPEGGVKRIALSHNEVREVRSKVVRYVTDTMEGSSGAPVFDATFRFVALHHAERKYPATKRRAEHSLNEAIWADLIAADVEQST